ncbi:rolling circle replication-associated protein [Spiroplasma sp. hyd1]|uniref:rolling circle replication-associated protein n=1 Tax=Spiroplasma sp. hyd1 TaxID=1609976 RepID=UPI0018DDC5B5|nr:hypothetical protein [Spiroplasma sp. hyd1]MBH8622702.1 hypothetical protein [Spiroplasma sp. hyd1]
MSFVAGQKFERRTVVTLTEVGDVARIRVSNMPYKVWNEPSAIKVEKAVMWKDEDDNWIEVRPAVYAPISYSLNKQKISETTILNMASETEKDENFSKSVSSLNRFRQNIQDFVYLNFRPNDYFITLTFKENLTDIKTANEFFNKFNMRFNKYLKTRNAEYKWLLVYEYQERGAVHFHILLKNTVDMNLEKLTTKKIKDGKFVKYQTIFNSKVLEKLWPHGFNTCIRITQRDIEESDTIGKIASYMGKYITKMFYENPYSVTEGKTFKMKNLTDYKCRLFRRSKNLIKPKKTRLVINKEINLDEVTKELFQKTEYRGKKNLIEVRNQDNTKKAIGETQTNRYKSDSARLLFNYLVDMQRIQAKGATVNELDDIHFKIKGFVKNPIVSFSKDMKFNLALAKKLYQRAGSMLSKKYVVAHHYKKLKQQVRNKLDTTNITLTI